MLTSTYDKGRYKGRQIFILWSEFVSYVLSEIFNLQIEGFWQWIYKSMFECTQCDLLDKCLNLQKHLQTSDIYIFYLLKYLVKY